MRTHRSLRQAGFTLIELMVVLAVAAVLLLVAAPSFREQIDVKRVRGVSDQLVTDLQFARSEAASRQEHVGVSFTPPGSTMTCYIVHTCGSRAPSNCVCDCSAAPGMRCPAPNVVADPPREIRTVQLATTDGVSLVPVLANGNPVPAFGNGIAHLAFDPSTGAMSRFYALGVVAPAQPAFGAFWARTSSTIGGSSASVRTVINTSGRPSACKPAGSSIVGLAAC